VAGLLTHLRGGDRENAGAGPDIQKTSAAIMFLNRFQTEARRLVSAGAECHAGIDADDDRVSTDWIN
jgi:hypothetical protein